MLLTILIFFFFFEIGIHLYFQNQFFFYIWVNQSELTPSQIMQCWDLKKPVYNSEFLVQLNY